MNAGRIRVVLVGISSVLLALSGSQAMLPAAEEASQQKPPPLVVDTGSPLLLKGGDAKEARAKKVPASVAENAACYVCHENYREEPLAQSHANEGIGCIDCHGKSYEHRNDENNTTPPDVMFPLDRIDEGCQDCHDSHDVAAADVVTRLRQRALRVRSDKPIVCTQCHGQHRLDHRTVVWDRTTGKLLTGSEESPNVNRGSGLETLKGLVGTWVQVGADGEPSEKVISTYRLTAAGSAVVEVLFPGVEHEMVTVYYQDGDDLMLTHYCSAKNQPRMKRVAGDDPNVLVFEFVDATNMQSPDDHHMRGSTIKVLGLDHIEIEWRAFQKGESVGKVNFDLVRRR